VRERKSLQVGEGGHFEVDAEGGFDEVDHEGGSGAFAEPEAEVEGWGDVENLEHGLVAGFGGAVGEEGGLEGFGIELDGDQGGGGADEAVDHDREADFAGGDDEAGHRADFKASYIGEDLHGLA